MFTEIDSGFGRRILAVVALVGAGTVMLIMANFSERSAIKNNWRAYANTGTGLVTTGVVMLLNLDGWQPATNNTHAQGMYLMTAFVMVMVVIMGGASLLSTMADIPVWAANIRTWPARSTHFLSNLLSSNKPVATLRNGEPAPIHYLAQRG